MSGISVKYSLYLVTGRELLPPGREYFEHLKEALKGGVTVVQVREKEVDTGDFLGAIKAAQLGKTESPVKASRVSGLL